MINEFVEKILVPAPEPTPEDLEQMKKDQYRKDKYRRFKDYELARRKKKLQECKTKEAEEFARRQAEKIAVLTEELRENPPEMPFETRQVPKG